MNRLVCIFAHPDDEAFGPGGTIASLTSENEVFIICCTDGDHQHLQLKNIRDKELLASAKILGVKEVFFLDFVDGTLNNNQYHWLADTLKDKLDELKPATILTFDTNGVTGHIDHIVVTSVVDWLFDRLDYLKQVMYFCLKDYEREKLKGYFVHVPIGRKREEVDRIVNISTVWDTKVKAMYAHESQRSDCEMVLDFYKDRPKEEWFMLRTKPMPADK